MAKAKDKAPATAPQGAQAIAVPGATWDPADPSQNNNADQPVIASPKAVPHQRAPFTGAYHGEGQIREGGGEPRPMFSSSLKE